MTIKVSAKAMVSAKAVPPLPNGIECHSGADIRFRTALAAFSRK